MSILICLELASWSLDHINRIARIAWSICRLLYHPSPDWIINGGIINSSPRIHEPCSCDRRSRFSIMRSNLSKYVSFLFLSVRDGEDDRHLLVSNESLPESVTVATWVSHRASLTYSPKTIKFLIPSVTWHVSSLLLTCKKIRYSHLQNDYNNLLLSTTTMLAVHPSWMNPRDLLFPHLALATSAVPHWVPCG